MKINTIFFVKIPKIFIPKIPKNCVVKMSDWNYHFYWFCYTLKLSFFVLKIHLVDHRHFSIAFAIFLKLWFCIENQGKIFHWKSIDFCQHHFPKENQYKMFYWICRTFWTCDFVLKTNTNFSTEKQLIFVSIIFLLKINTKFYI